MTNNKISAGTIARTAVLALALTNQILSATGHSPLPIESEQLEQIITTGITVVASLVAWWEFLSTPSARRATAKTEKASPLLIKV